MTGCLLTMGYLITEAETVLAHLRGRGARWPGHALAFDGETGFGLVQPLGKTRPAEAGIWADSFRADDGGSRCCFASAGGRKRAIETKVRRPAGVRWFTGEYLLGRGDLHGPLQHPFSGAAGALIGKDAKLLGVGVA